MAGLSPRELEVFSLIGQGVSTKQIAKRLFLSDKTVETHREKIKKKLNLKNSIQLQHAAFVAYYKAGSLPQLAETIRQEMEERLEQVKLQVLQKYGLQDAQVQEPSRDVTSEEGTADHVEAPA